MKKQVWQVETTALANVAAAATDFADLFVASTAGILVRVTGVFVCPALTAVSGIGLAWGLIRTTAVGTGGSALTPVAYDLGNGALPAGLTARSKPTGGATAGVRLLTHLGSSEELNAFTQSGVNLVKHPQGIIVRPGAGLKVAQETNSNVGTTNVVIVFEVEGKLD